MSDKQPRPAGRAESIPGANQDALGWITFWAGAATLTGLAAATVKPIMEQGPGAVVFAGSAAVLAAAASMRLGAPALAAWRRVMPLRGVALTPLGSDPVLRDFAGALAAQLGRLDEKLNTAIARGTGPGRAGVGSGA